MNITFVDNPHFTDENKEAIKYICEKMYEPDVENIEVRFNQMTQMYSLQDAMKPSVTLAGKRRYRIPTPNNSGRVYTSKPTSTGVMSVFFFDPESRRFAYFRCFDLAGQNEATVSNRITSLEELVRNYDIDYRTSDHYADAIASVASYNPDNTWSWVSTVSDSTPPIQTYTTTYSDFTEGATTGGSTLGDLIRRFDQYGYGDNPLGRCAWGWRG